jgi:hypothetical protein
MIKSGEFINEERTRKRENREKNKKTINRWQYIVRSHPSRIRKLPRTEVYFI